MHTLHRSCRCSTGKYSRKHLPVGTYLILDLQEPCTVTKYFKTTPLPTNHHTHTNLEHGIMTHSLRSYGLGSFNLQVTIVYSFILCGGGSMSSHRPYLCGGQRTACKRQSPPFTTEILGIKLKTLGLAASSFTLIAISLARFRLVVCFFILVLLGCFLGLSSQFPRLNLISPQ